jgi:hypothetical protein
MDVSKRSHELEMRELANDQIELLKKQIDMLKPAPQLSKAEIRTNALRSLMNEKKPNMMEALQASFEKKNQNPNKRF